MRRRNATLDRIDPFDARISDPNPAFRPGGNNEGGNNMNTPPNAEAYRADRPDFRSRAWSQSLRDQEANQLRYVDQSEDDRPVNVVWTDRKGRRTEFTESEMTMDNPAFRSRIEQFSKPRLRVVKPFWIRQNADIYRVRTVCTYQGTIDDVQAELGRRCNTPEEAIQVGNYIEVWYAVTPMGVPFRDGNGFLHPATEEEIAYAQAQSTGQQPQP
ncbi:hypothetical protein IJF89_00595 [Candidatus Saccharibacteria bacterium]|nr:hypothetical protein [Candidatus Saccharibacteria bacterium]